MPAIEVRGLREVQAAFRKVDADIPKGFRAGFLPIAQCRPTIAVAGPGRAAEPAIARNQAIERRRESIAHGRPDAPGNSCWQAFAHATIWAP